VDSDAAEMEVDSHDHEGIDSEEEKEGKGGGAPERKDVEHGSESDSSSSDSDEECDEPVVRRSRRGQYEKEKAARQQAYCDMRDSVFRTYLAGRANCVDGTPCNGCSTTVGVVYRCAECGPALSFCQACCLLQHRVSCFHYIEVWNGERWKFFSRDYFLIAQSADPTTQALSFTFDEPPLTYLATVTPPISVRLCSATLKDYVLTVHRFGARSYGVTLKCCSCHFLPMCVTAGLWPLSPTWRAVHVMALNSMEQLYEVSSLRKVLIA
jgi:hypothetical protein